MTFGNRTNFNPILGVAHFLLAITSGWALKYVNRGAKCAMVEFTLALAVGILGMMRFTHPNAGSTLHRICLASSRFVQLAGLPLIVVDALHFSQQFNSGWLRTTISLAVIAYLAQCLNNSSSITIFAVNLSALWNAVVLVFIVLSLDECYWTGGLVALELLNSFVLWRLARRYDIAQLFSTVSFCFFVGFALNSINEIVAVASLTQSQSV